MGAGQRQKILEGGQQGRGSQVEPGVTTHQERGSCWGMCVYKAIQWIVGAQAGADALLRW